ncbi:Ig-like domain-containing protein, partial [Pantoea sp. BAV 3049]|uniref:Ig-like domain-containing protein n=1 Tax=Pantoea sp. BAV 3049 TaxID=2654188 RepID=UPI0018EED08D
GSSGGKAAETTAHFSASEPDGQINKITLAVSQDNAIADGTSEDSVVATLLDAQGNPVQGQKVAWTVPAGVTLKGGDSASDSNGKVTVQLVSTVAGDMVVSGSSGGKAAETTAHFSASEP